MPEAHEPALITTIAFGLALAFVFGVIARRLRIPPIVGYLVAGVAVGPYTPGFVADEELAAQLAEIGVILLMFGVGLHFSLRDLFAVRSIAIPGAIGQVAVASLLGTIIGLALGWTLGGAIVLGLAISVASTVVLVRALMERGELDSLQGRIALGWLIVEDLFTVVVLVLLPSIAPLLDDVPGADDAPVDALVNLVLALGSAGIFAAILVVVGARLMPWLLVYVARLRDRELFTLAAVAVALGIAYLAYSVFGLSLALGAFLAGALVSESDTSHQVAADARPLRDVFSILFFVSVGMLVDPGFVLDNVPAIALLVLVIVAAKSATAFVIVSQLGHPPRVGLTVAAGLAQVGEFSFILASLGFSLGLVPPEGMQLVVSAALISITLNPLLFRAVDPASHRLTLSSRVGRLVVRRPAPEAGRPEAEEEGHDGELRGHAVIVGSGRVARFVIHALSRREFDFVVISEDRRDVERLRREGVRAIYGDATSPELLERAGMGSARVGVVAIPDEHAAGLIVERARALNPRVALVVRSHSERLVAALANEPGPIQTIHAELELAVQMTRYTLRRFGVSTIEAEAVAEGLRRRGGTGQR
jgi:monovalent cation:H+ antiporter-2, CPA2 family